ncbi:hypothetical protein HZC34_06920 [Candidatus Saganbacteria bacterium]|nr:hypothetical protein [Candidatus Saganbacteria bacterium]
MKKLLYILIFTLLVIGNCLLSEASAKEGSLVISAASYAADYTLELAAPHGGGAIA